MSRQRFTGGARKALSVCVLGLAVAGGAGCAEEPAENPDPRAYPGSDPEVSLQVALEEHKLVLPDDTGKLRFEVTTGRSYDLDLTFQAPCDDVPTFLRSSGFDKKLRDGFAPDYIVSNTYRYDWELGPKDKYAGLEERNSSPQRYLVVSSRTDQKCRVFLYSSY